MEQQQKPTLVRVQEYLEGLGCVVERAGPGVRIPVQRAAGDYFINFFVPSRTATLVVAAEPALKVPEEQRTEAAVLLSRMNFGMLNGCFEMNPDDGQLRYRGTINYMGTPLETALIANLFHDCDVAMRSFLPVLRGFMEDGASVEQALRRFDPEG